MRVSTKRLLLGMSTYIPGALRLRRTTTGGTDNARYCYSVWLRHLVLAHQHNLWLVPPPVVAELGPGDSLGMGLAALLSGVEMYYGLDVVDYTDRQRNLAVFDGLVDLFSRRSAIPDAHEFPRVKPELDSYEFPAHILTEDRLRDALDERRVTHIRQSLMGADNGTSMIKYMVPWDSTASIQAGSVDMIFSQAVLEHVVDLPLAYRAMAAWLKPGGFMTHQVDFRCHSTADEWNGHWTYADWQWRLICGKRAYLINREPFSTHSKLLQDAGFTLVEVQKAELPSKLQQQQLAPRFRSLSAADLTTSGAFILAVRTP